MKKIVCLRKNILIFSILVASGWLPVPAQSAEKKDSATIFTEAFLTVPEGDIAALKTFIGKIENTQPSSADEVEDFMTNFPKALEAVILASEKILTLNPTKEEIEFAKKSKLEALDYALNFDKEKYRPRLTAYAGELLQQMAPGSPLALQAQTILLKEKLNFYEKDWKQFARKPKRNG